MNKEKYIDDLKDIKNIMNRSSRFISLSGMSGVSAGLVALVGAYLAYKTVYADQNYMIYRQADLSNATTLKLFVLACATIILALGLGSFFTIRKVKEDNQPLWNTALRRLLMSLAIPLATGGVLCLILLQKGYIGFVAPMTLVFYGLALVNGSHHSLSHVKYLGILEIILGLLAFQFIGYGLLFWAIGFGVLHVIYGIAMQLKKV